MNHPPLVDPVSFARQGLRIEGRTPLGGFARLIASDVAPHGYLHWSVVGSQAPDDLGRLREFLEIMVRFSPVMTCGRCLAPITSVNIDCRRRFRLAASERQADLEDRNAESVDVIAVQPDLSLGQLIEDEAILSLPMQAVHEICPIA